MPPMLAAATRLAWYLNRVGVSGGKTLTANTGVRIMTVRKSGPGRRQAAVTPASTSTEQRGRRDAPRACFTRGLSGEWSAGGSRRGRGTCTGQPARPRAAGHTVPLPGVDRTPLSVLRRHYRSGQSRPIRRARRIARQPSRCVRRCCRGCDACGNCVSIVSARRALAGAVSHHDQGGDRACRRVLRGLATFPVRDSLTHTTRRSHPHRGFTHYIEVSPHYTEVSPH